VNVPEEGVAEDNATFLNTVKGTYAARKYTSQIILRTILL
jgi:hypothetical protein